MEAGGMGSCSPRKGTDSVIVRLDIHERAVVICAVAIFSSLGFSEWMVLWYKDKGQTRSWIHL